tara:strand:+ start:69 stop:521 length:453 start_codon:yes stop_codon:yes gene_type:complete
MDVIPLEYAYYCFGALTIYVLVGTIKTFYNIKDIDDLELIEEKRNAINKMKKSESMGLITPGPVFLKIDHGESYPDYNCLNMIPKDNRYINLWVESLIKKKGSNQCASPNCVNSIKNGQMIYMAFDSKFCCDKCRLQAQRYLGKYWNLNK